MKDFVTSSALTRLLANVFIFISLIVCLAIGAWEILNNEPINPLVYTVVSTGLAYSATVLGVHIGVGQNTATTTDNRPPTLSTKERP